MTKINIGYHASHEQFKPSQLVDYAVQAQKAGFTAALSSDHFYPWGETQGESGFAWSWLGAAMQATNLSFGIVNAPGQRYNPAIIAQAVATLCEMFPQRFWIATGSGQFLNEHITGEKWPAKAVRNQRLKESVDIMRALWAGQTVTHKGLFEVYDAKLYTLPGYMPTVIGAAITEKTAEWVGGWADGMITTSRPPAELKRIVEAFRRGGGEGKPVYLKVQLSYDISIERALEGAHQQWKNNVFPSALLADIRGPEGFDAAGAMVRPEDMYSAVRVSDSPDQHVEWLSRDIEAGVSHLYLHNVNLEQERFIHVFGEKVLPHLNTMTNQIN
ncbi:TIGR03885 family FMN-dependent LLM class oxidoreductase [Dyadobacter chenwenxiniae]|uniref:TIGR03885 family FMN-dependent LLM class oxidoreductase n=1 Tax=Dyadobacter chenwenxiniae TaxID=2906456 RepID=A0A9X1TP54_9BACT|nr:TIGR03885 family FMN-dependent LLM class oxidoreductase [Dyadobacter chenwenxiniae]MCF0065218.1 TIGR03885 family FMN-dependent LLM class oxidoreductase [Dyadobacter chenwenxiniae]UON84512.1 TIGR03885 family FMN-dependent LLM class oxidoreductase [Dyadobacter chenwenxiniae]